MSSVEEYTEAIATAHGIDGYAFLPDGTVVYGAYRNGSYDLLTPNGPLTDVDGDITSPEYLDGRGTILALRDEAGSEQDDLVEVDPETGDVTTVLSDEFWYTSPRPSPTDSDRIGVVSTRDRSLDVYTVNLDDGSVTRRSECDMGVYAYAWAPDGSRIVYQDGMIDGSTLRVVDLETGEQSVLVDEPNSEQAIGRSDGGRGAWSEEGIAFTTNHDTGYRELAVADPDGHYEVVHTTERDKYDPQWTADGSIVFVEINGGNRRLQRYDDGAVTTIDSAGFNTDVRTCDGVAYYNHADTTTAGDLFREGSPVIKEGGVDVPTYAPEEISYEAPDGREIAARLYEPEGDPIAGIVQPHGGPPAQHYPRLVPLVQTLVHAGFEVLAPDFRGSTGHGREFRKLSDGDLGGDDLRDVVAGAEVLRERGRDSVGIAGISYGGYLTLMGVGATDAFDVGASICGVVNWETAMTEGRAYLEDYLLRKLGGPPEENPELYEERSPITYAEEIDVPLLVVQGANDPRVPQSEAEQLVDSMDERSIRFEYLLFEDEGHGITRTDNRIEYISRMVEFFESHLQNS